MRHRPLGIAAIASIALHAPAASAQGEQPLPAPRPTAPDLRTGRPSLAIAGVLQRPFGAAELGVSQGTDTLATSFSPAFQLALPLSREWAIEAWGAWASFDGASTCPTCKAVSTAVGLSAVYHLLDGSPLDPWLSFGAGYRSLGLDTPDVRSSLYQGFQLPRLALGTDYFVSPGIGIGPYVDFTAGRFITRSPASLGESSMHSSLAFGLRIVLSPF